MVEMEDVIKKLMEIEGIDYQTAQALYNAGFTSLKELKKASVDDLMKVKGIDEAKAQAILQEFEKRREEAEEKREELKREKEAEALEAKEAEEEKEKKEAAGIEIVEAGEAAYSAKQKPELSAEKKMLLEVRSEIKERTPEFRRNIWYRYKRIDRTGWRRPRGMHNKMRGNYGYRPAMPSIGYGGPKEVRGLHPSGFEEVLVYTLADLESIQPSVQAARIGGAVGRKKRKEIEKKADELGIRILNPLH